MASNVIKNVLTQAVGFAPILGNYFEKCGIQPIIDENIPTDPRRKVLTHGQAAVAMITAILFQVMQLYRICRIASEKMVSEYKALMDFVPRLKFPTRLYCYLAKHQLLYLYLLALTLVEPVLFSVWFCDCLFFENVISETLNHG